MPATFDFTPEEVLWATTEVERQGDTPPHVYHMLMAWKYARNNPVTLTTIDAGWLYTIASLTKPSLNTNGYRTTPVGIIWGWNTDKTAPAAHVERLVDQLCDNAESLTVHEFTHRLLVIHPWKDGNGRIACITYNIIRQSPHQRRPVALPKFDFS
jgi:hypothetical protein